MFIKTLRCVHAFEFHEPTVWLLLLVQITRCGLSVAKLQFCDEIENSLLNPWKLITAFTYLVLVLTINSISLHLFIAAINSAIISWMKSSVYVTFWVKRVKYLVCQIYTCFLCFCSQFHHSISYFFLHAQLHQLHRWRWFTRRKVKTYMSF